MTAITSGTYGHTPFFGGTLRQIANSLFSSRASAKTRTAAPISATSVASSFRVRVREANEVRDLARSVELHSPGFAADLYAAASRHEGYDD